MVFPLLQWPSMPLPLGLWILPSIRWTAMQFYYLCILPFLVSDSFLCFVIGASIYEWSVRKCTLIAFRQPIRNILCTSNLDSSCSGWVTSVSTLCYYSIPCSPYLRSYYLQVSSFSSFVTSILFPLFIFPSNKVSPGNLCLRGNFRSPFPALLPLLNFLEKVKQRILRSYTYFKWNNYVWILVYICHSPFLQCFYDWVPSPLYWFACVRYSQCVRAWSQKISTF